MTSRSSRGLQAARLCTRRSIHPAANDKSKKQPCAGRCELAQGALEAGLACEELDDVQVAQGSPSSPALHQAQHRLKVAPAGGRVHGRPVLAVVDRAVCACCNEVLHHLHVACRAHEQV